MLKFLTHPWFLLNFFFILFWISPAEAARLLDWSFESNQNQLTFNTDEGVQPTAQLINNPARLVIDLPGVNRGNLARNQFIGGLIREVRVGQFNSQTTRIVVEMAAGYAIDPQQVNFQLTGDKQWRVQIPTPQTIDRPLPTTTNLTVPNNWGVGTPAITQPWLNSNNPTNQPFPLQIISSGFFLTGITGNPQIKSRRSDDRRTLEFEIEGANFPAGKLFITPKLKLCSLRPWELAPPS
jgi:N-acetylmuramoyl-L-alanine amidase